MLKVGITGGIGSGKTTVCRIFETLGIPIFYADAVAKQMMIKDAVLIEGIKKTFGQNSYFKDGKLNNKHIAAIVFADPAQLIKLNGLVHPAVFSAFDEWDQQLAPATPYSIKEAALLFESGSYNMCDKNIIVTSPHALKIARVTERDQVTAEQVMARMDKQFSDKQKLKLADYVIENNEKSSLILQALALHEKFLNL